MGRQKAQIRDGQVGFLYFMHIYGAGWMQVCRRTCRYADDMAGCMRLLFFGHFPMGKARGGEAYARWRRRGRTGRRASQMNIPGKGGVGPRRILNGQGVEVDVGGMLSWVPRAGEDLVFLEKSPSSESVVVGGCIGDRVGWRDTRGGRDQPRGSTRRHLGQPVQYWSREA